MCAIFSNFHWGYTSADSSADSEEERMMVDRSRPRTRTFKEETHLDLLNLDQQAFYSNLLIFVLIFKVPKSFFFVFFWLCAPVAEMRHFVHHDCFIYFVLQFGSKCYDSGLFVCTISVCMHFHLLLPSQLPNNTSPALPVHLSL
ncbi:hypothetical protein GOODEAATRI_021258 [Goodea atripinnis]|uniref:Uncharacterized protein n=1 Tax=Goodea atripinnis TaxID=208336 RepID=A0ABV0Q0G5_9TELE